MAPGTAPAFSSTGLSSALMATAAARFPTTTRRAFPAPSSPLLRCPARARPAPSATVRCCGRSDGNPAAARAVNGPAADAVRSAVADAFRPLMDNFHHVRSLKTVFDAEDYHIGMPFGALIACVGCYQLWKMDPSTFLDAALGYAFYRLSVLSSRVRRQGFSNDFITRIKFAIVVVMAIKDYHKNLVPLDCIRAPVWFLYLATFLFDVTGSKNSRDIVTVQCMSCSIPRKGDASS